ncbi:MAG: DUF3533 domain-containing protein [Nocardioides sp.]|uniref:DUF3533 domain-containing protein n=1 Tax=Nocardioides sp. TaxID=35761 RepID=UPI0039E3CB62
MSVIADFRRELADAISPRTVILVAGTLLLQLGFIASYVGAFHDPEGHDVPIGVVASAQTAQQIVAQLEQEDADGIDARAISDRSTAVEQIESGDLAAALAVDESGTQDELLVASGGGASLVTAVEAVAEQTEAQQGRTVTTTDVIPLQDGDARGLSGFYLTIGWIIGGYLMAALLGVAKGARPANAHRASIRLLATVPYAALAGLGGALIVDPWLGALTGHFWALWGLGTLLVMASATVTTALQVLAGTLGIGLTVLLFVVIGNPSAGGAFQWELLPGFWRVVGPWLPNGAGTEAIRRIVYFGGTSTGGHVAVIAGYAVLGTVVTLLASRRLASRTGATGASATTGGVQAS